MPAAEMAAEPAHVCLVRVLAGEDSRTISKLAATLEAALATTPGIRYTKSAQFSRIGSELAIPPARRFDNDAIAIIAAELKLDATLTAQVEKRKGRYRLILQATNPVREERLAEVSMETAKPKLQASQAKELAVRLVSMLLPQLAKRRKVPVDDVPTTSDPSTADAIAADEAEWAAAMSDVPEQATATAEGSVTAAPNVEMRGRIGAEHFSYFKSLPGDRVDGRDSVEVALGPKIGVRDANAAAMLIVRRDFVEPERDRLDVEEATLEVHMGPVSVQTGRMIVAWGTGTLSNPTDILNPLNQRDLLESEKLGTIMARAGITFGAFLFEGYVLPVPEAARMPLPDGFDAQGNAVGRGRWLPELTLGDVPQIPLRVHLGELKAPRPTLDHTQGAVRISGSVAGVDVSCAYARLYSRVPSIFVNAVPAAPLPLWVDVDVAFKFPRLHMVTADFETTFERFRVAGEALGVWSRDTSGNNPAIVNPYAKYVLGVDYQTAQFNETQSLHLFLEFADTHALKGDINDDTFAPIYHPIPRAVYARLSYQDGDKWEVDVNIVSSVERYDIYINPHLEYAFLDRVRLKAGLSLLQGKRDVGLFGPFRDNSRTYAALDARF